MSSEQVLDSLSEPTSYDEAAQLLSLLCPDFIKSNAEYGLQSPESFACLLYRNEHLFEMVKVSFVARDFHDFWDSCVPSSMEPMKGYINTSAVLDGMSFHLINLVNGKIDTPLWTMSDVAVDATYTTVKRFTLHSLMDEKRMPSMLFYDLGGFSNDPILNERVEKLFRKDQNTFLVNASASGKTRLLYEGLYRHWGIYVTARADDQESCALQEAMGSYFGDEQDLITILPSASALGYRELLHDNIGFLNRRLSTVLLVHLLVFREFLKTAHTEGVMDDENLRLFWLLAQLWRPCIGGCDGLMGDVHEQLLKSLEWNPLTMINDELKKVIEDVNSLLPEIIRKEGLFVAIDEANVAAKSLWRDPTREYSFIKCLIRIWRDQLASLECPITFVVAGTEISPEVFQSSSPEWSSWKWTSDTGSFDDREVQRNFILPFLPSSLSQTPSGVALFERIWKWCRPRHRLTTVIVQMLIEDKVTHPHGVLNRYIKGLMSYEANDAVEYIASEGPCSISPFFNEIGNIIENYYLARSATHEVVFHYIITGNHPPFYDISRLVLVTSAVGHFKDKDMQVIAMDQPGPTIAAAIWLGNDKERVRHQDPDELRSLRLFEPFSFFFNLTWPNGDNYSSASYIALYLAHAFVGGRVMSDVFDIPDPLWLQNTSANLVVLRKDGNIVQELVVGSSELLPNSPPLGYRASTVDDVVAWFQQKRIGAFCVCPPDCWADLIFILKLEDKYVWVVLRAVGHDKQLDTKDLYPEYERLTEKGLFSRMMDTSNTSMAQNDFSEVLKSLPNTLAPSGSIPILRVLASFPNEPLLPRRNLISEISGGPVSVLKVDTFKHVTEAFSPEDLIEGLISSMHGNRSSYSDDSFVSINPASSLPMGKQEDMKVTGQPMAMRKSSHKEAATEINRSIPRHKTSPPEVIADPAPGAHQIAKEAPIRGNKRARKEESPESPEPLSARLRRSPREHHAKGSGGK